jgi:hypothetical protein
MWPYYVLTAVPNVSPCWFEIYAINEKKTTRYETNAGFRSETRRLNDIKLKILLVVHSQI